MLPSRDSLFHTPSVRYKEHEDGFLRLQLIRYESVELTEQLMRERQTRQADEDEDQTEGQELLEEPPGAAPSKLRGVLLEEHSMEDGTSSAEESDREEVKVLTGGLLPAAEDSGMQQLQEIAEQQGMQVV